MFKVSLAAAIAVAVLSAGSFGAAAETKCKSGQVYSEELGKCVAKPKKPTSGS